MLLPEIWTPLSPVYLFFYTWQFVVSVSVSLSLSCQLTCPQGRTTVLHLAALQSVPDQSSVAVGNPECLVLGFCLCFPNPSTNCDNTNTPNTTVILLMHYKTPYTCQLLLQGLSQLQYLMTLVITVLCFPSLAIVPDVSDFTQHH